MAAITAQPTMEGINILNTDLKTKVTKFALIGNSNFVNATVDNLVANTNASYTTLTPHIFAQLDIESAVYDENGVLTFHLALPYDTDYSKYIYGIALLYIDGNTIKTVSVAKTPKVAKVAGVGGSFSFKVAVLGSAGEIVFKIHDYVTTSELEYAIDFQNLSIMANAQAITELTNILIERGVITNG